MPVEITALTLSPAPARTDGDASRETVRADQRDTLWRSLRIQTFPLLVNVWPLLLFVSQKVFVVPSLALVGLGDAAYRRDLMIAAGMTLIGVLVYLGQFPNFFDQAHLLGFISFVLSMPLVNHATRYNPTQLRRWLTYLTLFNVAMSVYILVSNIDLYGFRGLNRIEGTDGVTSRIYFESSSLAAVFLLSTFRTRILNIMTLVAVFVFVVFFARSAVVMALLGLNLILPYILRSSAPIKVGATIAAVVVGLLIYIYLPVIRPDIGLSLASKQFQLDVITSLMPDNWTGWGWGSYLPPLATDKDQPYQIEMQLPMLMLQVGPIALIGILVLTLSLFMSAADKKARGYVRFIIYALIGFNNPWLFVPSWYLTCQLLFRDERDPPSAPTKAR